MLVSVVWAEVPVVKNNKKTSVVEGSKTAFQTCEAAMWEEKLKTGQLLISAGAGLAVTPASFAAVTQPRRCKLRC